MAKEESKGTVKTVTITDENGEPIERFETDLPISSVLSGSTCIMLGPDIRGHYYQFCR